MSIQSYELFSAEPEVVRSLLRGANEAQERPEWPSSTFSGFPTAMLFRPDATHVGSLHYMFFPARACQRFHHHPGGRYIVLIGDVDMHIHHSIADRDKDPTTQAETLVVPALTLATVRFPAFYWHCFETKSDAAMGVLALAFHDDDKIDEPSSVDDDLMEDRTTYWSSAQA